MEYEENDKELYKRVFKKIGIYFLLKNNIVVYVGQTRRGLARIYNHQDKDWDSFYFIECEKEKLLEKERYFIAKYKPIYNKEIFNENSSMREIAEIINSRNIFNKRLYLYDISRFLKNIKYKPKTKPIKKDEAQKIIEKINENRWIMYNVLESRNKKIN